jgi:hypothetical protein
MQGWTKTPAMPDYFMIAPDNFAGKFPVARQV